MSEAILPLWPGREAPYSAECGDQAQPSVKAFPVEGARVAVVICPGGSYEFKAENESDPIARRLNREGIAGYVLDYRVKPCNPMTPLTDAQRAIRLVRSMGYDYVGIVGFSAGGNLTCSAATHYDAGDPDAADPIDRLSCRPDFFVPCYAVVSMTQFPHTGSILALLGGPDQHPMQRFFSAELNITPDTPPAYIWHTANDELVPVENSLLLASALARAGVMFELHVFPDAPHGADLGEGTPDISTWPAEAARFIRRVCP